MQCYERAIVIEVQKNPRDFKRHLGAELWASQLLLSSIGSNILL